MPAPKYYSFSPITGEYTGQGEADQDPLTDGAWLFPGHTTSEPPPETGAKQRAIWGGDAWSIVPDHRGEIWWAGRGESVEILVLGDPSLEGLYEAEPPAPPASLDEQLVQAPDDLFGGPTLGEVFNGY